jgi:hypothetical protein
MESKGVVSGPDDIDQQTGGTGLHDSAGRIRSVLGSEVQRRLGGVEFLLPGTHERREFCLGPG